MMAALLLYAYTQGVFSSRKITKACIERMDFAAVIGFQKPDFRTISLFCKRHLTALGGLFRQVLVLCRQAGLVPLGHVALDGTKVKANASKHKAMSYDRMVKADNEFAEVVKGWLQRPGRGGRQISVCLAYPRRGYRESPGDRVLRGGEHQRGLSPSYWPWWARSAPTWAGNPMSARRMLAAVRRPTWRAWQPGTSGPTLQ
jgi:hypothetical protein